MIALKDLESRFIIVNGYWISPSMVSRITPTTLVLTNGKVVPR